MRVLVTGGAGFVGSHLTDRLIELGHRVTVVDNLETGRRANVHADAVFYEASIVDRDVLDNIFAHGEFDAVAHCAASYADRNNWSRDTLTNVLGTVNVCELAREYGVERILYFQTALCYGHNPGPFALFTGQHLAPDNSYAITKTAGEQFIEHSGISYVSLRLANIYGPRNVSGPIPTFFMRISEEKTCKVSDARRDYVYINDALDVAIPALLRKGHGVYHLSSGGDVAIADVFVLVAEAMGAENVQVEYVPRMPGDAPSILLDPTSAEDEFGWKASTPLAEGIAAAVGWYAERGVEQTFTHLAYAD